MNFSRAIFLLLIFLISAHSNFSQDKNTTQTPLTIKANLMVLDSKNQFADVKPEDLKLFEDGIEQKITKLTKKESLDVGLVVDSSGSLRSQFDTILGTANLIVENLRERDEAFTVSFVSSNNILLTQDWTSDKKLLKGGIGNMYVQGGHSAVIDAVMMSAEKLIEKKNDNERSALILISDCDERNSFFKLNDLLKTVKNNGIEIYIIAFTQELVGYNGMSAKSQRQNALDLAKTLAVETGGAAYFPEYTKKKKDEIIEAAKAIILELRSQYVVEYVSTNSDPKDSQRNLSVEIAAAPNGEKRSAFVRSILEIGKDEKKK